MGDWKNTRRGSRGRLSRGGLLTNGVARKAGGRWVERRSSITSSAVLQRRNNIKGQGCPGALRGAADLGQSTIAPRDAKTTDYTDLAGKKSGLCAMQLSPCCSLVAVASMAEVGPPSVMSQSSHGGRMAG